MSGPCCYPLIFLQLVFNISHGDKVHSYHHNPHVSHQKNCCVRHNVDQHIRNFPVLSSLLQGLQHYQFKAPSKTSYGADWNTRLGLIIENYCLRVKIQQSSSANLNDNKKTLVLSNIYVCHIAVPQCGFFSISRKGKFQSVQNTKSKIILGKNPTQTRKHEAPNQKVGYRIAKKCPISLTSRPTVWNIILFIKLIWLHLTPNLGCFTSLGGRVLS